MTAAQRDEWLPSSSFQHAKDARALPPKRGRLTPNCPQRGVKQGHYGRYQQKEGRCREKNREHILTCRTAVRAAKLETQSDESESSTSAAEGNRVIIVALSFSRLPKTLQHA